MLRLASYDIVFQEIPGEVTLALNISGCPNRCPGCHSSHLQEDVGELLDDGLLEGLLEQYGKAVTCVCFMGGDGCPGEIERLARLIREKGVKTAWYSGRDTLPAGFSVALFDFIKLGRYDEKHGGLRSPSTNQRFYRVENGKLTDITHLFHS